MKTLKLIYVVFIENLLKSSDSLKNRENVQEFSVNSRESIKIRYEEMAAFSVQNKLAHHWNKLCPWWQVTTFEMAWTG